MTLPASGPISFNAINVELGVSGTTTANINQATYRTLAAVPSGTISLSNFYGKTNRATISHTFTSSTADASLNLSSISGYIAGVSDITVTINSGVYLYCNTSRTATAPTTPGLNITGGTSGDTLTIVNNGFILGGGGKGGDKLETGIAGGPALSLSRSATINNTNGAAYIAGGGGGGGGLGDGGGGGGGGAGGGFGGSNPAGGTNGGAGGGPGAAGAAGTGTGAGAGGGAGGGGAGSGKGVGGGGGGGRILAGTGGAGGTSGGGTGGAGGSANAAGANGSLPNGGCGGGGGYGASGGSSQGSSSNRSGGAGGKAVNLNGNSVTWVSGNTTRVYGSVS